MPSLRKLNPFSSSADQEPGDDPAPPSITVTPPQAQQTTLPAAVPPPGPAPQPVIEPPPPAAAAPMSAAPLPPRGYDYAYQRPVRPTYTHNNPSSVRLSYAPSGSLGRESGTSYLLFSGPPKRTRPRSSSVSAADLRKQMCATPGALGRVGEGVAARDSWVPVDDQDIPPRRKQPTDRASVHSVPVQGHRGGWTTTKGIMHSLNPFSRTSSRDPDPDVTATPDSGRRLTVPGAEAEEEQSESVKGVVGRARAISNAVRDRSSTFAAKLGLGTASAEQTAPPSLEQMEQHRAAEERARYDQAVVDLLDVIDPEVSTLSTLSDVQNSLFVPNLGRYVNRAGYVRLARPPSRTELAALEEGDARRAQAMGAIAAEGQDGERSSWWRRTKATITREKEEQQQPQTSEKPPAPAAEQPQPSSSSDGEPRSRSETLAEYVKHTDPEQAERNRYGVSEGDDIQARGEWLVLPDGLVDWDHWTPEERAELDDYVRHLLHSRKWKARRTWRGFKQYVRTPLGAFVTIYASLLTFWGAAWVLFLIGWLNAGSRQAYFVEICDQILTALFCVVGIGLAPFRTVDTYHMYFIAKYHRKTLKMYRELGLPPLPDENDLPDPAHQPSKEDAKIRPPVLTVEEQATLMYHQMKFAKSHTFYKPHETATHKAFPLDLLIVIVCLLDFHSIFQMALGSTTWSISYHHQYKKILTSIILSCSISCNISAGLVIAVGNRRTRKTEVVEERLRRAVTEEAVRRRQRKREEEEEEERERLHRAEKAETRRRKSEHHQSSLSLRHGSGSGSDHASRTDGVLPL
ncbi:hypothetical protein PUNSTDRAFT_142232 [Punctularia strigosozonata HHB-11173 SS5]|uniref:uncharacterized protein n=1 Tax=Punctularia strigosozonata (strain HHB-11173) TaxID=741275 RepID=UPI0004417E30|nr:uncharacterized protein PUNSTDRAFT_142232 [Punctularia strigosozonata HHB-11173 SS5]EIN12083.1 hypothetical protein PUNSTDRAFT_142232 [Punctularia strigosozonata HHB-11173 SS5]